MPYSPSHLTGTEGQKEHKPLEPIPNALNTWSGQKTMDEDQKQ